MIVHYRFEDTFIQGVLTTYVFAHHRCDGILIIDDDLLMDKSLRTLIQMSVSPNIKIYFYGLKNCLANLEKAELSSLSYYVIMRDPVIAYELVKMGYAFKLPIICGLQAVHENTYQIMKGVAFTEEEGQAVDSLVDEGVKVLFDPSGLEKNIPWEKLRKAFQNAIKKDESSSIGNKNTSLLKTMSILDCFLNDNQAKLTMSEIQQETQIPFSTCYRLSVFLQENGYLDKDDNTSEYFLGWKLVKFAQTYNDSSQKTLLKDISSYYLKHLQEKYNETASLFIKIGMRKMCIHSIPSTFSLQVIHPIDELSDINLDATGLVLLSSATKPADLKWLRTDQDPQTLIANVSKDGFSMTSTENGEGIRSISAPIRGESQKVVAALTVQGPACRFTTSNINDKVFDVVDAASKITNEYLLSIKK